MLIGTQTHETSARTLEEEVKKNSQEQGPRESSKHGRGWLQPL